MTIETIANRLVELCRQGQHDQAYQELFANDATAYEMEGLPDRIVQGKEALLAKSKAYTAHWAEVHGMEVTDPLIYADFFAVGMMIDVTHQDGTRQKAEEMCVYEVRDGKIVAERFFYSMG